MSRTRVKGVLLAAVTYAVMVAAPAWAGGGRLWLEAKGQEVHQQRSTLSQVARAAMPSVVSITTHQASADSAVSGEEPQKGIGSGFIIHPDGYILTSAHVVEGASDVFVSVLSPRGYPEDFPAKVVGQDPRTDCALLKVDTGRKLQALKLSSASHVEVADWIVVIGNPFGLAHSVTVGVVSYKGRQDVTPNGRDGDFDYMQMDASINPGNSGGPVLDLHGDVVAIANAVNVAGQGIGFAVPIDIAKAVLPHLKAHGKVRRGWMGIAVADYSKDLAAEYGLSTRGSGVVVSAVEEQGPAGRAGLRVGDVIVGLDSRKVDRAHKLRWQVAARGVGKSVVLQVRRGAQPLKLRVKLEELPTEETASPAVAARRSPPRKPTGSRLERVRTDQPAPRAAVKAPEPAATPSP
ncbi:S1C family serine protease [Hyalangium rubrum]|uniref:Trypsin-like peptidase domain-containing protein n=1 Tax=Hyalangium rubrum TaxID=3103134 RepID=A0ABU5H5P6_9BACT|nr:trypsin-like peptidase domain-containing protein [Hyalangium sp. s54d21]MDY7228783.1 trypsin-like peptidase domain-containing protein [Hyalangium sp. s54d21]